MAPSSDTKVVSTRTWVKVCGIARAEDVAHCSDLGADAIGFLVVRDDHPNRHPDQLTICEAAALREKAPHNLQTVALTKSLDAKHVAAICEHVRPNWVQIQADIDHRKLGAVIDRFPVRLIKKVGISPDRPTEDLFREIEILSGLPQYYSLLLDTAATRGGRGGNGKIHDWELSAKLASLFPGSRLVLAGGLTPDNVSSAIKTVKPWGVDVMSGVSACPGVHDQSKVARFISAARGTGFE